MEGVSQGRGSKGRELEHSGGREAGRKLGRELFVCVSAKCSCLCVEVPLGPMFLDVLLQVFLVASFDA